MIEPERWIEMSKADVDELLCARRFAGRARIFPSICSGNEL